MIHEVTHACLVDRGRRWLLRAYSSGTHVWLHQQENYFCRPACSIVVTDLVSQDIESPDVLGWTGHTSYLIECKVSRADFLADQKKAFRKIGGMGDFRYYLAPKGLLSPEELPTKWGLLEMEGRCITVAKNPEQQEAHKSSEVAVMHSVLRRLRFDPEEGVSIKTFLIQSKCRATLSIRKEGE
jgi:hypothetical protein